MSAWSVRRHVSFASWCCHGRSWTNTVWSVGVALSCAGTATATSNWGTSQSTAWPALPLTTARVHLKLPALHQTRVRGCRIQQKCQTSTVFLFALINSCFAHSLYAAKVTVTCKGCTALIAAEDIEKHEVYIFFPTAFLLRVPQVKHRQHKKNVKIWKMKASCLKLCDMITCINN